MRTICRFLMGIAMSLTTSLVPAENVARHATVWFGTGGSAKGIYRAVLDLESGDLSPAELASEIRGAGFLTIDAEAGRLYSIGQIRESPDNVAAYQIGADHLTLELLGTANSGGGKPTHISLSRDQRTLLLAHYGGGSVAALPIDADGRLVAPTSNIQHTGSSVHPDRQNKPHPHWIGATPDNQFVFVPDLGADEVVIYRFDAATHTLTRHGEGRVPPGAGPRHLAFHPNGLWVYVINELGLTVTAFRYNRDRGSLDRFQTAVALPKSDVKEILTSGSEIRMHPSGKFLYAAIRGHDVIAVFAVHHQDGTLTLVEREPIRGSWPRNFGVDPTGRWLLAAGAESSTVAVFRIDQDNGRLVFTRNIINVPHPICVAYQLH